MNCTRLRGGHILPLIQVTLTFIVVLLAHMHSLTTCSRYYKKSCTIVYHDVQCTAPLSRQNFIVDTSMCWHYSGM